MQAGSCHPRNLCLNATIRVACAVALLTNTTIAGATPTRAALSLFRPGGKTCRWVRVDLPHGPEKVIAILNQECPRAEKDEISVRWRGDLREALVQVPPKGLWRVSIADGRATSIASPHPGSVDILGYTKSDEVVALTLETAADNLSAQKAEQKRGSATGSVSANDRVLRYGDETFPIDADDTQTMALAHGFVLGQNGSWQHHETRRTSAGDDYLDAFDGVSVLELFHSLAPSREGGRDWIVAAPDLDEETSAALDRLARDSDRLSSSLSPDAEKSPDSSQRDELPRGLQNELEWITINTSPRAYVRGVIGDFVHTSPDIVFTHGHELIRPGAARALDSSSKLEEIRILAEQNFIIVSSVRGRHPRVYDARAAKVVYRSQDGQSASFWP
jgi:hypothetical protein